MFILSTGTSDIIQDTSYIKGKKTDALRMKLDLWLIYMASTLVNDC